MLIKIAIFILVIMVNTSYSTNNDIPELYGTWESEVFKNGRIKILVKRTFEKSKITATSLCSLDNGGWVSSKTSSKALITSSTYEAIHGSSFTTKKDGVTCKAEIKEGKKNFRIENEYLVIWNKENNNKEYKLKRDRKLPVRQIQKLLQDKGFNAGPIDGILGQRTKKALMAYQTKQGLPSTGILDKETLRSLGISRLPRI